MVRPVLAAMVLAAAGCGSTAPGGPGGDGGLLAPDGGPGVDGGAGVDGGTRGPDGGAGDGGAVWRILPGQGLDVPGSNGATASLRYGQTLAEVRPLVGTGADSPLLAGPMDRSYGDLYVLFFANTDGSNDGNASAPQPTLTDPDRVRYLTAGPTFPGTTPGGSGPGSPRAAVVAELGAADLSQIDLDNPAQTVDRHFGRGLIVTYGTDGGVAQSLTVWREARKPDEPIRLRDRRLGPIVADSRGGGSSFTVISQEWGEPDQIDNYTILGVIPGSNYTYVGLGLSFVTEASIGQQNYRVTGIVFFDPYHGRTDFGNLGVRSLKADFDASLASASCPSLQRNLLGQEWTVYRLAEGRCEIRLGVVFDAQGRARVLFLNFPNV
jgi:hypothetical protein